MLSLIELMGIVAIAGGCAFWLMKLIATVRQYRSFRMASQRRVQGLLLPKSPRLRERL